MAGNWKRFFLYRSESVKTTWAFRFLLLATVLLVLIVGRHLWITALGRALVCDESIQRSDAILVDNFEINYVVFERAEQLMSDGLAARVLVPTQASDESGEWQPSRVFAGITEVMVQVARLRHTELIPIREIEPISLNAAYQIRDFLRSERLQSIIIVTPAFRSRRSALVYDAVLGAAGIRTTCVPVFAPRQGPETWSATLHGIQSVVEQHIKLQYYRFYVLPYLLQKGS